MEGGEIGVPWLVTIEVGVWEGSGVEGDSIDRSVLCPSPLQHYSVFQAQVTDVLSQFLSTILVSEHEWIVFHVVDVELDPVSSRVIWIFFATVAD